MTLRGRLQGACRRALAGSVAVAVLTGCVGSAGGAGTARLRLVVADNHVREEGVECAGARPFRHVHPGASYAITSDAGATVDQGELPPGRAHNADPDVDWGFPRIPTVCIFDLAVPPLPGEGGHELRLPEDTVLPFDAAQLDPHEPLVLLLR